jgi:hypothetical protein
MYVRTSRSSTLVANNRVDAAVQLIGLSRGVSAQKAEHTFYRMASKAHPNWELPLCNLTRADIVRHIRTLEYCRPPWVRTVAEWDQSTCLHVALASGKRYGSAWVNSLIVDIMRRVGMYTVILQHEAPGPASDLRQWKTEVVRVRSFENESVFDASGWPCETQLSADQCAYCRGSPLTRRSCGAEERERAGMRASTSTRVWSTWL